MLLSLIVLSLLSLAHGNVLCPLLGAVSCDDTSNCFQRCCLSSNLCPSSSCVASFLSLSDLNSKCEGDCLQEVACEPINNNCKPGTGSSQHCIGKLRCLSDECEGNEGGETCLYKDVSLGFTICLGVHLPDFPQAGPLNPEQIELISPLQPEVPRQTLLPKVPQQPDTPVLHQPETPERPSSPELQTDPGCICEITFVSNLLFSLTNYLLNLVDLCPGVNFERCTGSSTATVGPQCLTITATDSPGLDVTDAVSAAVGLLETLPGVVTGSITSKVVSGCNTA